ncbi:NosD domain-containing protein [Microlunatus sp. GCM10028923]|uniref:NosD domain-containing protein n=1 Tax=Microlunatus sp. GCM10028923 TaxID=3273400 RepID=UPI0036074CB6
MAILATGLALVGPPAATAEIPGFAEAANVADDFDRGPAEALGTAAKGGRYVVEGGTVTVGGSSTDGYGELRLTRPGSAIGARLADVRTADQRLTAVIELPALPTDGNGVSVSLLLRQQGDGGYLATATIAPDGTVSLGVSRRSGGSETRVGPTVDSGLRIGAGQSLALAAYLVGDQPVEIGVRAQRADQLPGSWLVRQDGDADRLRTAGTVGVRGYLARDSGPVTVRLHELSGAELSRSVDPAPGSAASGQVGAAPIGAANYPVPAGAIFVAPHGSDAADGSEATPLGSLGRAIAVAPDGATIVLRAGSYTEQVHVPASKRLTIQPYPSEAVWLDGSAPLTRWSPAGGTWTAPLPAEFSSWASHSEGSDEGGFVNPKYPMAAHPDQVFVDGEPLVQVAAGTTPGQGQFAADDDADLMIIGTDPAGREVRASVLGRAVVVSGQVTLRGLGIRRYATSLPQMGTVYLGGSSGGSVLEQLVVEDNATQGLSVATGNVLIDRVTSRDNGMVGIHAAYADGLLIKDSLITGNNTEHFNAAPAAAGIKIGRSRGITVTGSLLEGNLGVNGIWLDESVVGFTLARNTIRTDDGPTGIVAELSDTGVIAGNDISGPQEGITLYNTGRVVIANNLIRHTTVWDIGLTQDERRQASHPVGRDPRHPVPDPTCPWQLQDVTVINNVFAGEDGGDNGGFQFYGLDKRTRVPLDAMNVRIDGNLFSAPGGLEAVRMAAWGGDDNQTINVYRTPSALAAAKGPDWTNLLTGSARPDAAELDRLAGSAVALPDAVAAALGLPAGARLIGPPPA